MLHQTSWPRPASYVRGIACILYVVVLLCVPQQAFARALPVRTSAEGPTFQSSIGFNSRFRDGNWVPVHVTLQNTGADFTGVLTVDVPTQFAGANSSDTAAIYRSKVTLAAGAQKQVTLYAPFSFGTAGVTQNIAVTLLDSNGKKVGAAQSITLHALQSSEFFVGVLSDHTTGFGPISGLTLPQQPSSVIVEPLKVATMPDNAAALDNFNLLILDNFDTSTLSASQHDALQQWVTHGGSLVVAGGPEWRRTFTTLPASLVPLTLTGTTTLPAATPLLPTGTGSSEADKKNRAESVPAPVTVSTGTGNKGIELLASGSTPLLTQLHSGQGNVFYMAFDPTLDPIVGWSGAPLLWKSILLRVLGDQAVTQGTNQYNNYGGAVGVVGASKSYSIGITNALQSLLPNTYPSIWLILVLLFAYILILGPIRLLIVRRLKKRDWSWRIALITILVFSVLTYGFALQQKGTSIVSDSISVIQLSDSTTSASNANAHITTYLGVFVPSQGDFQVRMSGQSLVQPNNSTSQYQQRPNSSSTQLTTITPAQEATDVNLQGVDIWTLRSLSSERDRQLRGTISSHLTIANGVLTGSVTNTLPYSLSDVNILVGNQYLPLVHLNAGETQAVHLTLTSTSLNPATPTQPIASQMASKLGISQYGSNNGDYPQDEAHRHVSILSAFGGGNSGSTVCNSNGTCYQVAVQSTTGSATHMGASLASMPLSSGKATRSLSGGGPIAQSLLSDHDPLTIANAPVTLIGWADPHSDLTGDVTINGNHPNGQQELLVQAPLMVSLTGGLTVDSSLIKGQLVDVQGTNAQTVSSDIYALGTGSMTYEYTVPGNTKFQANVLSLQQIANLNQMVPQTNNNQPFVDATHLQVRLYNWKTRAWDTFAFTRYALSVPDAQSYTGSAGRILVQLVNTDASSAQIIFNKPLVQIQGTW